MYAIRSYYDQEAVHEQGDWEADQKSQQQIGAGFAEDNGKQIPAPGPKSHTDANLSPPLRDTKCDQAIEADAGKGCRDQGQGPREKSDTAFDIP